MLQLSTIRKHKFLQHRFHNAIRIWTHDLLTHLIFARCYPHGAFSGCQQPCSELIPAKLELLTSNKRVSQGLDYSRALPWPTTLFTLKNKVTAFKEILFRNGWSSVFEQILPSRGFPCTSCDQSYVRVWIRLHQFLSKSLSFSNSEKVEAW